MNFPSSHSEFASPGSTDNGLVEGIRSGEETAWTRFVDEYAPMVYLWCRNCDLQPADALDVSQQVFQSVSRSISTYVRRKNEGSFRGWLFVITKNAVRKYLTRTLRGPRPQGGSSIQMRLLQEPDFIDEESLSAYSVESTSSITLAVEAARKRFDKRTWQCFWMVAMEGYSATEVGTQLGMKPAAVRQAKCRVIKQLRKDLDGVF